jgi:hypothetical protein
MSDLLQRLKPKERRGSKPRCHFLTHGAPGQVAENLTQLISPFGSVSPADRWMPQGFDNIEEAQLDNVPGLLDPKTATELRKWWLAAKTPNARTPNFDIASTCTIQGKLGLLLIEAKAHDEELNKEIAGKKLTREASQHSMANHGRIGKAIAKARDGLREATSMEWHISRDSHYQMSNRFAWAWKLTELGFAVALVYLGFLNVQEMKDKGKPFANDSEWERLVKAHSEPLFPHEVWNRQWTINGRPFIPMIRSIEQSLDFATQEARLCPRPTPAKRDLNG